MTQTVMTYKANKKLFTGRRWSTLATIIIRYNRLRFYLTREYDADTEGYKKKIQKLKYYSIIV